MNAQRGIHAQVQYEIMAHHKCHSEDGTVNNIPWRLLTLMLNGILWISYYLRTGHSFHFQLIFSLESIFFKFWLLCSAPQAWQLSHHTWEETRWQEGLAGEHGLRTGSWQETGHSKRLSSHVSRSTWGCYSSAASAGHTVSVLWLSLEINLSAPA